MKVIPSSVFEQEPTRQTSKTKGDITILIEDREVPLKFFETWPKQMVGDEVDIFGTFEVYSDLSETERSALEGLRSFEGSARYFSIQTRKKNEITRFEIKFKLIGPGPEVGPNYTFIAC
jgi:hypothetical protein